MTWNEKTVAERIANPALREKVVSPEEAALIVRDGMTVGMSGFTGVGYPKAFPRALAKRAKEGDPVGITLITGASVGDELDGELARAGVTKRRYPYQTNKDLRDRINSGEIKYVDIHLGQVPVWIRQGVFGKIDLAVIEASSIDEAGNIVPTASVGCADMLAKYAEKVVVEISTCIPKEIAGLHDIYSCEKPPFTKPIPITAPGDRVGIPYIPCDPDKIAAVIFCDVQDSNRELAPADEQMQAIAEHLIAFLEAEVKAGRLTDPLPPLQSGVGGVANAVLSCLEKSDFQDLTVYTEVMQDAVVRLIRSGKVKMASGTALTISPSMKADVFGDIENLKDKIVLRPEEMSNSPEVIRRLGLIAMNTALEADLSGNVNSTHVGGRRLMNGIGGSGDFARNAGLTIFTTASTAKGGTLSCIVPVCSHIDHTEHDVDVIITEQGAADLRGLTAFERAEVIIENCAHPDFRAELREYVARIKAGTPVGHGFPARP
ncbi:MAG: succinate CoA transferase [Clostridia bacterium]|nr:succinate CoA transferase [Clostridia bacterium]